MKKTTITILTLFSCFVMLSCQRPAKDAVVLQRSFFGDAWERFDYVRNDLEIKSETTYDLSLRISFTEDYPYNYIDLIFTVFAENGEPYRSKEYKLNLKDAEGNWSSERIEGCYTFNLPINKQLKISDPGTYQFQIEQKMPKTPLVGVRELTLLNNKNN